MPDEIIVFAEPEVEYLGGCYRARLLPLALSSIKEKKPDAIADLLEQFKHWVAKYRADGLLAEWLLRANVTWGYVRDFPDVKSRFKG